MENLLNLYTVEEIIDQIFEYFDYYPDRIFDMIEGSYQSTGDNFLEVGANKIKRDLRLIKEGGKIQDNGIKYESDDSNIDLYFNNLGIIYLHLEKASYNIIISVDQWERYQQERREEHIDILLEPDSNNNNI